MLSSWSSITTSIFPSTRTIGSTSATFGRLLNLALRHGRLAGGGASRLSSSSWVGALNGGGSSTTTEEGDAGVATDTAVAIMDVVIVVVVAAEDDASGHVFAADDEVLGVVVGVADAEDCALVTVVATS